LNGQEQKCSIAPSDPAIEIGSFYQRGAFFFGQEGDGSAFMPLRGKKS
jgi:hypothetical protein